MTEWADCLKTVVLLGVKDERQLLRWKQRLEDARIICESFEEPDRNNETTALAVMPGVDPELFKNVQLL